MWSLQPPVTTLTTADSMDTPLMFLAFNLPSTFFSDW